MNAILFTSIEISPDLLPLPKGTAGITLIAAWLSNHVPSKVWDEVTNPFPNLKGYTVEFGNG